MDRKTFIQKTVGVMLVGIPAYTLLSCSSSDNGTDTPPPTSQKNCLANGTVSSIGTNHGHSLTVSKTDVESGAQKTYSIQGSSGHDHQVTVTAANFSTLKNNNSISVNSTSGDGHTHSVTVSCA
ncbi:hypothetical protein HCG49_13335 [Arenibacter sp. 6A1]|uniref:hypothetical protein n=1 Tax=Arenibacter sp. 6A1 TaxID=2720391 RepID=UPI0014476AA5|nr:hypothetical protein [Arenibacter sp. 6A1]NKI27547.1 hypothetical protein [Arenibacter sp. 6A1]